MIPQETKAKIRQLCQEGLRICDEIVEPDTFSVNFRTILTTILREVNSP